MLLLFKRLFRTVNTMNAMNKIIDELTKENGDLKEKCIAFRNRAIASEELVLKLNQRTIDDGLTITWLKRGVS